METKSCLNCPNLRGCGRITNVHGRVQGDKVVLPPYTVECPDWGPTPVGENELALRGLLMDKFGMAAIQAVHRLSTQNLEDEEEDVSEEHIDFGSLLFEGITKTERSEQLRYITDEEGNVILDEDGEKEIRRTLYVRRYAVKELGLPSDKAQFWSTDELVKAIIKEEDELGYFKKKRKAKAAAKVKQTPKAKENRMPVVTGKNKVVVRRGAASKAATSKGAVPSKVSAKSATPVTSKKRKTATKKPPAEESAAPSDGGAEDLSTIRDDIQKLGTDVQAYMKKVGNAIVNEVNASIEVMRREMVNQHTSLHDSTVYHVQLNASKVPLYDEEDNHVVDDGGELIYVPYECEDPTQDLLQPNKDITAFEVEEGEEGEE
jgi:hypothetical protein